MRHPRKETPVIEIEDVEDDELSARGPKRILIVSFAYDHAIAFVSENCA